MEYPTMLKYYAYAYAYAYLQPYANNRASVLIPDPLCQEPSYKLKFKMHIKVELGTLSPLTP